MSDRATAYSLSRVPIVEGFVDHENVRQRFVAAHRNRLFQALEHAAFVQGVYDEPATGLHDPVGLLQHFEIVRASVEMSEAAVQRHDQIEAVRRKMRLQIAQVAMDETDLPLGYFCHCAG